jgi:squalene cyclase
MRITILTVAVLFETINGARAADPPARDDKVDKSIDKALEFLDVMQDKNDGAWRGGRNGKHVAVTSLAVMAFLSAGHVPGEGKYGETVEKGVRWVLKKQQPNGLIATDGGHEMYQHGIATLMLAEVAGMTDGELGKEVRKKLEKAVAIILKAQRGGKGADRGGWRYHVQPTDNPNSDMSVTGWQLMALRATKNLGCDVPADNIERAVEYVKRCQNIKSGGFGYTSPNDVTIACTGTGILALELCGKDQHKSREVLQAGALLIRDTNLPQWGQRFFFYSIYYGAQATFQLGDNFWSAFRPRLHQVLLSNQKTNGSWDGSDNDTFGEGSFGPSYSTAMCVLALTVEYRFLPIYQREEPADKDK